MIVLMMEGELRLVGALEDDLYLSLSDEQGPCSGWCLHACRTYCSGACHPTSDVGVVVGFVRDCLGTSSKCFRSTAGRFLHHHSTTASHFSTRSLQDPKRNHSTSIIVLEILIISEPRALKWRRSDVKSSRPTKLAMLRPRMCRLPGRKRA